MFIKIAVLAAYFLVVMLLGLLAKGRLHERPSDYFLAGRGLRSFVLLGTMAATNFSAFTVFGASGAGYRDGLAFWPIMAFGTGFMAITFWLVGRRVWELGRRHDLVTPAELIQAIYQDKWLAAVFAMIMVIFTVPYLALQPLAGGKVLGELFGMPMWAGAGLVTFIIMIYTLRGGLKAVAWTDVFQGLLMLVMLVAALVVVTAQHGGWSATLAKLAEAQPAVMSRPGPQGGYSPQIWFSFLLLWFFCDPMFPQLFQRFYAARKQRALGTTALWYPLICTVVFTLPIVMGVMGRLDFPGLAGGQADNIVPMLMTKVAGDFMGTLVLAAGLAALMSTMDSQLLTLGSIFTRDLYPLVSGRQSASGLVGRGFVFVLALAGLAVALGTDTTILNLGLTAFTGLAALFPMVLGGLILREPRREAAWASLLAGEGLALAYHFKLLPDYGFLPAVPVIAAASGGFLVVQALAGGLACQGFGRREAVVMAGFGAIFLAAQDYWRWGQVGGLLLGWPLWGWYFVGLSVLQTALTWWWLQDPARARA